MLTIDLKLEKGRRNLEFSETQKKVIVAATKLLKEVLNHSDFQEIIEKYTWKRSRGPIQERFNHTLDSRELVFKKIVSGDDLYSTTDIDNDRQIGDNDIDVHILPYKTKVNIVGRTYRNNPKTWINLNNLNAKLKKYDFDIVAIFVAQNMIHEYCHNLGYGHKGNNPNKHNNQHSVPYAVGNIVAAFLKPVDFNYPEEEVIYSTLQRNRLN